MIENELEISEITWQETIPLRHEVLWPNKALDFCHVEGDEEARHFGAFLSGKLVAVASVFFNDKGARLRKFATATEHQGKGIGTTVITHILSVLQNEGVTTFWCDARESARGFYERFGMKPFGDRFFKCYVPYFKMSAQLGDAVNK